MFCLVRSLNSNF